VFLFVPSHADTSSRQNVLFVQDLIMLAHMHNRPQTEIDSLMAQLKKFTGA